MTLRISYEQSSWVRGENTSLHWSARILPPPSSATNCQIGPRLIKIGPNTDHFLVPIRTKSRPEFALNPDQYHEIRLFCKFSKFSALKHIYFIVRFMIKKKTNFQHKFIHFRSNPDFFMQIRTISGPIS